VVVRRVVIIFLGVPPLRRRVVEIRIGEQPQADDARRLAVGGADRHRLAVDIGAARAPLDAGILALVLERIGRTLGRDRNALVHPQAVRVGPGRLLEARLVDEAVIAPSVVTPDRRPGLAGGLAALLVQSALAGVVFVVVTAARIVGAVARLRIGGEDLEE